MSNPPFARECRYLEVIGIKERAAKTVVALLAAEVAGWPGATLREVNELIGGGGHSHMCQLERLGWIEAVGRVQGTTVKVWKGTRKAWRELGLEGWSLLKEVA